MKRSFFFLIFLLFLQVANAETTCAGANFNDSITLTNTYGTVLFYEVTLDGNAKQLTNYYSENQFFLENGQSKTVYFETTLPFPGNYELNVLVSDSRGRTNTYTYNYNVINCHKLNAEIITNNSYCLNKEQTYILLISNTGKYNETFNYTVNNQVFNQTLNINESFNKIFNYNPNLLTNNTINLTVNNEYLNIEKDYILNLHSCEFFDYSSTQTSMCENENKQHYFTIMNMGVNNDTYYLYENGDNIILLNSTVKVNTQQAVRVPYIISSQCDDYGIKETSIGVVSDLTLEEYEVPIKYEVLNCYNQKVTLLTSFEDYCEFDNKSISLMVENTGIKNNNYTLYYSYAGINNTLSKSLMSNENITLTINTYNISTNDTTFYFSSNSINNCNTFNDIVKQFQVLSYEECYSGLVKIQDKFYDENTKITITNNGTRPNNYTMHLLANNEIDNYSISLNPSQSKELYLSELINLYEEYGIESFEIIVEGEAVNVQGNTTYYENNLSGLLIGVTSNASIMLGLTFLLILIYAFIRKK